MSEDECRALAEILERFVYMHEMAVITEGVSEKKYQKGLAKLNKAIDKLRKGKWKGVIKPEMTSYARDILQSYNNSLKSGGILY